jgi:hypothetical protein
VSGSGVEAMGEGRGPTGEVSEDHEFGRQKIPAISFFVERWKQLGSSNSTHINKISDYK